MAALPVEVPNLLKFPMGKLCYDLVLEVMDELEPKDMPELMKVDRRFRWILLQKPARIFGKQIHLISVDMDCRETSDDERKRYQDLVFIMKFAESKPLPFYFLSHKVLLLSQIERCSVLAILEDGWGSINKKKLSALKKALVNLKQVDTLEVKIYGDNFNDCLWNFKAEVTDRAALGFYDLADEIHQQLMLSLINRSQNCKIISVYLCDDPDFYPTIYEALSKTQLELFVTWVNLGNVKTTMEWILHSGIPSENKEAACFVHLSRGEMAVEINNLIKNFPEIRQVNEPNKTFIRDTMMETLRKHRFKDDCDRFRSNSLRSVPVSSESLSVSDSDESLPVSEDSRSYSDHSIHSVDSSPIRVRVGFSVSFDGPFDCYLKRIDEKRDCIYVVRHGFFFAKYVSSIQF